MPEEVGLMQDNCIFLGAVRLAQNGPVFGIEYRWELAEAHARIATGKRYQVPIRSTAWVVTRTPSCGRIISTSPIHVWVY